MQLLNIIKNETEENPRNEILSCAKNLWRSLPTEAAIVMRGMMQEHKFCHFFAISIYL